MVVMQQMTHRAQELERNLPDGKYRCPSQPLKIALMKKPAVNMWSYSEDRGVLRGGGGLHPDLLLPFSLCSKKWEFSSGYKSGTQVHLQSSTFHLDLNVAESSQNLSSGQFLSQSQCDKFVGLYWLQIKAQ